MTGILIKDVNQEGKINSQSLLEQMLHVTGWALVSKETYTEECSEDQIVNFQQAYEALPKDPYGNSRSRAYLKLKYNQAQNVLFVAEEQAYSQTYKANSLDGGKKRYFSPIEDNVYMLDAFKTVVCKNISMMCELFSMNKEEVTIGLHMVRYDADLGKAAYSSPIWLHKDDEPVVFVNVINESPDLVGGDSIIAHEKNAISRVVHLEPFESILLTKNCYHAVTPMEAPRNALNRGFRDIFLTTIEEDDRVISFNDKLIM